MKDDENPKCPDCKTIDMDFTEDEWKCPKCGRTVPDGGDHPDRDDYEGDDDDND